MPRGKSTEYKSPVERSRELEIVERYGQSRRVGEPKAQVRSSRRKWLCFIMPLHLREENELAAANISSRSQAERTQAS